MTNVSDLNLDPIFKDHVTSTQTQTEEGDFIEGSFNTETTFQDPDTPRKNQTELQGPYPLEKNQTEFQVPSFDESKSQDFQTTPVTAPNVSNQFILVAPSNFVIPSTHNIMPLNFVQVMMPLNQSSGYFFTPTNMNFGPINPTNFESFVPQNPSNQINENRNNPL